MNSSDTQRERRQIDGAGVVEVERLTKRFGRLTAVDSVDLALPSGRIYGLLGPNGSGKTTLIRLISGLAKPTAGWARVLGVRMPDRRNLARIGYMTQSDGIYAELSVWENVRFFADLFGVEDRSSLNSILDLVQLADRRNTPVHQLSGGMRRRLSLACTLVHRPRVLFLDEPTVGVDPALRVEFWDYFRRLAHEGATLLVASHVMDEADRCDELLLIRHGRLIARGDPASIREQAGTRDLEAAFLRLGGRETER